MCRSAALAMPGVREDRAAFDTNSVTRDDLTTFPLGCSSYLIDAQTPPCLPLALPDFLAARSFSAVRTEARRSRGLPRLPERVANQHQQLWTRSTLRVPC